MNKLEILTAVKKLQLPKDSYIVFGSCPLALLGIRESGDIDMFVSEELAHEFRQKGWIVVSKDEDNDDGLVFGDFEAFTSWNFGYYRPTLKSLLRTANYIDGIPFASLLEVRNWKVAYGRTKDKKDIELIDNYLSSKV